MISKHSSLLLFIIIFNFSFSQTIVSPGVHPDITFTNSDLAHLKVLSEAYKGQSKIQAIGSSPYFQLSTTQFWHAGSWERGYFTPYENNIAGFFLATLKSYPIGSHPLYRKTSKFGRGHLHSYFLTGDTDHLNDIKDGIDYLLSDQFTDGGFIQWYNRCSITADYNSDINGPCYSNATDPYPSSYALRTLCEFYLSNLNYRNSEVYDAIVSTSNFLINKLNQDNDYGNSNNQGLMSWALAGAYKVTKDCRYLNASKQICKNLINTQSQLSGIQNGIWKTGVIDNEGSFDVYHDTKIYYHLMTVRGMIETFSIIQNEDESFKQQLASSIKKAINHVITYRTRPEDDLLNYYCTSVPGTVIPFTPHFNNDLSGEYLEPFMLLAKYGSDNSSYFTSQEVENLLNQADRFAREMESRLYTGGAKERYLITGVNYYRRYREAIANNTDVFAWDGPEPWYDANQTTNNQVTGDFDRDGKEDDIATFYDYGGGLTKIHVWESAADEFLYQGADGWWSSGISWFDASKISGKIISGDFDRDGYKDDIAAFYDYGGGVTKVHVWKSTGTSFQYQGSTGWWSSNGYDSDKIKLRVLSGDFDRDGYHDDIAAFYDYGASGTKIHTWTSTGTSFQYQGAAGWWSSLGYNANNVSGRLVSGDFDRDGRHDDIAAFYDYGGGETRIHVWTSNGSSLQYQYSTGWWSSLAYNSNITTGRVVSGDFDRDGYIDDISALSDYGSGQARIHVWKSTGGSFLYEGGLGWWNSSGYDASKVIPVHISVSE